MMSGSIFEAKVSSLVSAYENFESYKKEVKEKRNSCRTTKIVLLRSSRYTVNEGGLFVISPSVSFFKDKKRGYNLSNVSSSDHFDYDFSEDIANNLKINHKPEVESALLPLYSITSDSKVWDSLNLHFCYDLRRVISSIRPEDQIVAIVKVDNAYNQDENHFLILLENYKNSEKFILGITEITSGTICLGMTLKCSKIRKIDILGECTMKFHVINNHARVVKVERVHNFWLLMRLLRPTVNATCRVNSVQNFGSCFTIHGMAYYSKKITSFNRIIRIWYKTSLLNSTVFSDIDHNENIDPTVAAQIKTSIYNYFSDSKCIDNVTIVDIYSVLQSEFSLNLNHYKNMISLYTVNIFGMLEKASPITDYLYLGSEFNASDIQFLQSHKIRYILNATNEIDNFFIGSFTYFNVNVADVSTENLLPYFDVCTKFIENARNSRSNVLVHCQRGVSRSATIVIAYLMKFYSFGLTKAIALVKRKRPFIQPNKGFYDQLKIYSGILSSSFRRSYFNLQRRFSVETSTVFDTLPVRYKDDRNFTTQSKKCLADINRTYSL